MIMHASRADIYISEHYVERQQTLIQSQNGGGDA